DIRFDIRRVEAGDSCLAQHGVALPTETVEAIRVSDACLKGPVGESAADVIVRLRQMFNLYANVRPAKSYPRCNPLREGVDLVIVRENTEDLYKGCEFEIGDVAVGLRIISLQASRRIARFAFQLASERDKLRKVTSVHKANVLRRTCGLFARACREAARDFPSIVFEEMYVDAAAMNLIRRPEAFDVIVTTNMFGDILSDEAAQVVGGLGMAPSANIGEDKALFEPVHGSAPDIAGRQEANPFSMILSAKMMMEWLAEKFREVRCREAAEGIEKACVEALEMGAVTPDLGGKLRTLQVGEKVAELILNRAS
ncbi:MAG: isocitrate/isopropylmalate dehydrogenase family protein, partial [Candidatus Bathyarchaeia archaeon]